MHTKVEMDLKYVEVFRTCLIYRFWSRNLQKRVMHNITSPVEHDYLRILYIWTSFTKVA